MRPHRGSTILTLGILGLVMCPLLGTAAWFMADDDLRQMKAGTMDWAGRDLTNAGRVCGMVATAIFSVQVVIMCVVLLAILLGRP